MPLLQQVCLEGRGQPSLRQAELLPLLGLEVLVLLHCWWEMLAVPPIWQAFLERRSQPSLCQAELLLPLRLGAPLGGLPQRSLVLVLL